MESVRKYAVDCIRVSGKSGHSYEVAWALFLCKGLNIKLMRSEVEHLFSTLSSTVALVLMDLNSRGLIDGGIDDDFWRQQCGHGNGLRGSMWMLAYEAVLKDWWSVPTTYVAADPLFGPMLSKRISFYDANKNVPSTKKEYRRNAWLSMLRQKIFSNWQAYA
jgi:hypothetical protein